MWWSKFITSVDVCAGSDVVVPSFLSLKRNTHVYGAIHKTLQPIERTRIVIELHVLYFLKFSFIYFTFFALLDI